MLESKIEYLSPEAWQQWHTELLQSTVNRVYNRVPFYRKVMEEAKVTPDVVSSLSDLARLPFTTRRDLSANYPYDLFAVPLRDIVRIHTLRGGQAAPVVLGYTPQDLDHRRRLSSRFLSACGVSPEDVVQICLDPGMAVWGQELKDGAEALGALVIAPDPLGVASQVRVLVDFKTTVLITSPSYGRHLLGELTEAGIPPVSLSLRRGIFVGEYLGPELRQAFQERLSISTFTGYGILEAVGPGMAYECEAHAGLHLAMDHFIPEVVDPATGHPLRPGERGELVISTVTTRANPLLRFRTGDLTRLITEPCSCGRTTWRIDPVQDRCDELITIRGLKMDPAQIEVCITRETNGLALPYLVVLKPWNSYDRVELWLAINEAAFSGSLPEIHGWIARLEAAFEEAMGLSCTVRPVEHRTLEPYLASGTRVVRLKD